MNYASNSEKSKNEPEEKKLPMNGGVAKGQVTMKKKSLGKKIVETFIADDISNVRDYVVKDVIVPSIKNAIADSVCNSVNMLLGTSIRKPNSPGVAGVSYNKYYKQDKPAQQQPQQPSKLSYDEIGFDYAEDAENILKDMRDLLETYKMASIADLIDLINNRFNTDFKSNYTDTKYGWRNLSQAGTRYFRGQYFLDLPRAIPLD